ncbi:MAG: N-6 DNA methylase, partial [Candidatus Nanopelagicales bacterium]
MAPAASTHESSAGSPSETIQLLRESLTSGGKTGAWPHPDAQSPRALVEFTARIAKRSKPDSILDPVCGYGMLLAGAAEASGAETVHGMEINAEAAAVASIVLGGSRTMIHGDCLLSDEELLEQYDLIVADPPLGARLSKKQSAAIGLKARSLGFAEGLLVWAASRLTEDGVALVVVEPHFFFNKQSSKVHEALGKLGCRVVAAIHLPGGER